MQLGLVTVTVVHVLVTGLSMSLTLAFIFSSRRRKAEILDTVSPGIEGHLAMVSSVSYPSWEELFVLNHIACLGETPPLLVDLGYPMVKLLRSRIQKEKNILPRVFRGAFFGYFGEAEIRTWYAY